MQFGNGLPVFGPNGVTTIKEEENKKMDNNSNEPNYMNSGFQGYTDTTTKVPETKKDSNEVCKVSVLGEKWTIKVQDLIYDPHDPIEFAKVSAEDKSVTFDKRLIVESNNIKYSCEIILKEIIEMFMIEAGIYELTGTPQWIAHNMDKINKVYIDILNALKIQ